MAHFRSTTSKGNTYLQLVQSFRNHKGQPQSRVLANIGNITKMSDEQIERLTLSFIRCAGMQKKFQKYEFEAEKAYHYGTVLPAMAMWYQLGLGQIIDQCMPEKVEIPVSRIALIQTANRFSDPGSKLACFRWYCRSVFSQMKNFVNFPDDEQERLHTYYRALDYLCGAKKEIEKRLYCRLLGAGMDNSLVLYDLTSTYFEGTEGAGGLKKKRYSRDKRSDCEQIVVGLVMGADGIPIAHHVFAGNRVDKTTVGEVVGDLKGRFGIRRAIVVGDRGMVSYENIETVKGKQWGYILGLQRRNRKVIEWLLKKVDERQGIQEFGWDDLSDKLKGKYEKKVRFVVRYNEKVAQRTRKVRERKVAGFEHLEGKAKKEGELKEVKKSNDRLKGYLRTKRMSKYYKIEIKEGKEGEYRLEVERNEEVLERERLLDGRYFLQTEESQEMSKEQVDESYRSLQIVERAFRAVKGDLEIRPVYVRKETRIRGHVLIAYFALLIERLMEKKLKELYPEAASEKWVGKVDRDGEEALTMMRLYEELDGVRLIPLVLKRGEEKDQRRYICTKIDNNVKKVLSAVGVKNAMRPERLSFAKAKKWREDGQLLLDF